MVAVGTILVAVLPEIELSGSRVDNPFSVGGLGDVYNLVEGFMYTLGIVTVISSLVRLRRARGVERQQIKWFFYAAVLLAVGSMLKSVVAEDLGGEWIQQLGSVLRMVGLLGVPIAMGIAILRYRPYEIDFIINRTLVYSALTVVLAGLYQAIDAALHYVLVTLTHLHTLPGSIIAALVIAALFHPARHRIQQFVDGYLPFKESGRPGHSEEANPF